MTRQRALLTLVASAALLVSLGAPASAVDDDLQSVGEQIADLDGRISAAAEDRSELASGVRATQARMEEVLAGLSSVRSELAAMDLAVADRELHLVVVRDRLGLLYERLARTRADLDEARAASIDFAREAYMSAGQGLPTIAFSAGAVSEISLSVEYMGRLTADSERTVARYEALEAQEDRERAEVAAAEAEVAAEVAALEREEATLAGLQGLLETRGDQLQEEYERQQALIAEVEAAIDHWEGEITALEREQLAIAAVIDDAPSTGAAPVSLLRPVPGGISSGFGPRVHPIYGTVKMHNGVDMDAGYGEPIRAAAGGTVILSGVKGGYGNTVMIDHGGGMVTLYAHQSTIAVAVGQSVEGGQTIGYVGSTGTSTSPHLHFEVRIDGTPVDPVPYL